MRVRTRRLSRLSSFEGMTLDGMSPRVYRSSFPPETGYREPPYIRESGGPTFLDLRRYSHSNHRVMQGVSSEVYSDVRDDCGTNIRILFGTPCRWVYSVRVQRLGICDTLLFTNIEKAEDSTPINKVLVLLIILKILPYF